MKQMTIATPPALLKGGRCRLFSISMGIFAYTIEIDTRSKRNIATVPKEIGIGSKRNIATVPKEIGIGSKRNIATVPKEIDIRSKLELPCVPSLFYHLWWQEHAEIIAYSG